MFVLQLTVPQPESMLGYTVAAIYLLNFVGTTLVSFFVIVVLGAFRRNNKEPEPVFVDVGYDSSPSIADSYSMSKAADRQTSTSDGRLFSDINGLGVRNGSFSKVSDKN